MRAQNSKLFVGGLTGIVAVSLVVGLNLSSRLQPAEAQPGLLPANVPVGTIVAYAGPLDAVHLGIRWTLCDGKMIKDKASMFNGKNVPDLTDDRFLMGVKAGDNASVAGGSNKILPDGAHKHHVGGVTGGAISGQPGGTGDPLTQGENAHWHIHGLNGETDSQTPATHDHGGDKRPAFLTTHFIIRIK